MIDLILMLWLIVVAISIPLTIVWIAMMVWAWLERSDAERGFSFVEWYRKYRRD